MKITPEALKALGFEEGRYGALRHSIHMSSDCFLSIEPDRVASGQWQVLFETNRDAIWPWHGMKPLTDMHALISLMKLLGWKPQKVKKEPQS